MRLLYVSRAVRGVQARTVERILEAARANNTRDAVTGALLAYGGRFLQVLEGPAEQVLSCFDRIRADPRHHDIQVLEQVAIEQREFGPWAMRHIPDEQAREPAVAGFLDGLGRQPRASDVTLALALLRRLAEPTPPPAAAPPASG